MTAATASGEQNTKGWIIPLAVLIVGMFMSVLDTSIVNVAIPRIQTELGASARDVEWVVTGYTLALGVIVPLSGWLGNRIGLTRLYTLCLLGFAGASALCGLAGNLNTLIVFRILQAIPGGVLPVITMTILYQIVPREQIGSAMGVYGLGVVFAPAVGPTLGGYLVEYTNWRLIFYINVPVGILGAIAAFIIFPRIRPTSWPKFDLWGFLAIGYGLFALLLATSKGQDWGWTGYRVLILLVSSALSLAVFVVIELEVDKPLLDVRAFLYWPFTNSLLLIAVITTGLFTTLYYIPQFLQVNQGLQPFNAGLVLMPSALVMVVLMPIAGRLYDRFGPRWPAVIGLLFMTYGSLLLTQVTTDTPREDIILWTAVRNIGTGLAMMPIMTAGVAALPHAMVSAGSALNNVTQRVTSSLAVAGFGAMITAQQAQLMADRGALLNDPDSLPQLRQAKEQGAAGLLPIYQKLSQEVAATSYANAFLVVAGLCAVGVLLALMLRSGPARPAAFPIAPAPAAPPEATAPLQPAAPPAPATPGRGAVTPVPERAKAQS
ncbi:MAG TPA: DHA2 family efflux MFS transporter permease subunit [Pseudonocardia sp.]|uniref:DHA2 family efflux MFS transporter permease subunit n=1 Tax=Pseudonocardia sp. TaxID=60912 RepID=UPI002EDA1D01